MAVRQSKASAYNIYCLMGVAADLFWLGGFAPLSCFGYVSAASAYMHVHMQVVDELIRMFNIETGMS